MTIFRYISYILKIYFIPLQIAQVNKQYQPLVEYFPALNKPQTNHKITHKFKQQGVPALFLSAIDNHYQLDLFTTFKLF